MPVLDFFPRAHLLEYMRPYVCVCVCVCVRVRVWGGARIMYKFVK